MGVVGDILRTKGPAVWSISPDATIYEALQLMADKNVGAVVVLESSRLAGIFSERDYARKVVLQGKTSRGTPVREAMTENVLTVAPDWSIEECMRLMTEQHVRHLPVLNQGQLVGIISIGDVVKDIISDQRFTISQLEEYITGRR